MCQIQQYAAQKLYLVIFGICVVPVKLPLPNTASQQAEHSRYLKPTTYLDHETILHSHTTEIQECHANIQKHEGPQQQKKNNQNLN